MDAYLALARIVYALEVTVWLLPRLAIIPVLLFAALGVITFITRR